MVLLNNNEKPIIRKKIFKSNIAEKWIIVTSINHPTEQCKNLSKIKGFKFLVVGDKKTPNDWKLKNAIFLDLDHQELLNFTIYKLTPINSYNRKNIGYLYAIMHGAKFIYDTDDYNSPFVDLLKFFDYGEFDYGLILKNDSYKIKNQNFVNPYAHFGQPTIWPRGYPLNEIRNNHLNEYYIARRKSSIIQQALVNGDPDVDAILRLTMSKSKRNIELYFDSSSPSIQIPEYLFTPFNSQNTLYSYKAFWSLYLPTTVSFRLSDIWRAYWAQRLMWLLNETITFRGPSSYQIRNSHPYLKDFEEETSMYLKSEDLIKFLIDWKCFKSKFYDCVIDLSMKMANKNFWDHKEVNSIKKWLNDLTILGYKEPKIIMFESKKTVTNLIEVRYTPKFQRPLDFENYCCNGKQLDIYEKIEKYNYFRDFCNNTNVKLELRSNYIFYSEPFKVNFTLLITFNKKIYEENILFIKNFYGDFFQNIVFCGKNILNYFNSTRFNYKKFDSYSFIELDLVSGYFHYDCMNKLIEINYNTEGVFLMSDDVLLKYWNLVNLDQNKIWYFKNITADKDLDENCNKGWMWWNHHFGCKALKELWIEFDFFLNGSSYQDKHQKIKKFINGLKLHEPLNKNNSIPSAAMGGADLFYLPRKKFDFFHIISQLFRKHNVFLEIAVPTILAGIDEEKSMEIIEGKYFWGKQFDFKHYNSTGTFAHPVKISQKENIKPICEILINDAFKISNSN